MIFCLIYFAAKTGDDHFQLKEQCLKLPGGFSTPRPPPPPPAIWFGHCAAVLKLNLQIQDQSQSEENVQEKTCSVEGI